jgi:hypothetical protein
MSYKPTETLGNKVWQKICVVIVVLPRVFEKAMAECGTHVSVKHKYAQQFLVVGFDGGNSLLFILVVIQFCF